VQALHRMLGALQLFTTDRVIADGRELMKGLTGEHANEAQQQLPDYLKNLRQVLAELAQQINNP
ncbi:MAG: hypothetical protein WA777_05450, partial [Rhodanobacter sp.]